MSRLLPDEQNFLLKLQGVKMSKCVFNRVFDLYDQDSSGFIEDTQLEALLTHTQVLDCADVPRCLPVFMQLSDGGKLHRSDLSLLLCHTKDTPPSPCPAHI
ncbi:calbindin-like [Symphorus nematophorus]